MSIKTLVNSSDIFTSNINALVYDPLTIEFNQAVTSQLLMTIIY